MEIIINADDFGLNPNVNEAVKYCFQNRYIHQTTLMLNTPYVEQAVKIAKKNNFEDKVGLHLNLVTGTPLSTDIKATKLCDSNGMFNGLLMDKANRFYLDMKTSQAVKCEIVAQIDRYLEYGFRKKHVDSHRHSHTNYSVLRLLLPILMEYNMISLRLCRNIPTSDTSSGLKGIYRKHINNIICSFNSNSQFGRVKYFGSLADFERQFSQGELIPVTEIMIHPIMEDGKLQDAINKESIEEWLRRING